MTIREVKVMKINLVNDEVEVLKKAFNIITEIYNNTNTDLVSTATGEVIDQIMLNDTLSTLSGLVENNKIDWNIN